MGFGKQKKPTLNIKGISEAEDVAVRIEAIVIETIEENFSQLKIDSSS